ncbi:uncharacterized protein ColSpa_12731 [Colletotrichum spaethianum]|uniref:Uncharacterized protein n=1 Tax=Colletotrichum spaethianum TaxID=700344 RepID=A0AA37PHQ8_9PEZI|nr:uncharacterized protein ColSpa_12731 [Colletotrichum spaethianum]GKT52550.1 hypothetical protein ColSpa_12731 [Colletotrichum spaethianum]
MGFWSSLVDGVSSAGQWVLNHSGDISSVVGTVTKVAGIAALEEFKEPGATAKGPEAAQNDGKRSDDPPL